MRTDTMMFVPYVCCGDPDMEFTRRVVKTLAPYADIIELGIPFSDPIADGKTIQEAINRALRNKVTADDAFLLVKSIRSEGINTRFVFMTYYNIVYSYGCENFLQRMKQVGVEGIIIPDLPFGEDRKFEQMTKEYSISIVNLIAPNTDSERAEKILQASTLFTYLVSVAGVTGARDKFGKESTDFVMGVRKLAGDKKRLCTGFGISGREQAMQFALAGADGVIVGSRLINIYSKYIGGDRTINDAALAEIGALAKEIKSIPVSRKTI